MWATPPYEGERSGKVRREDLAAHQPRSELNKEHSATSHGFNLYETFRVTDYCGTICMYPQDCTEVRTVGLEEKRMQLSVSTEDDAIIRELPLIQIELHLLSAGSKRCSKEASRLLFM